MIVIVDYGMGNLGSIVNMFKRIGTKATISSDPEVISQATKLILPGVGAFDAGMERLASLNLIDLLTRRAMEEKIPVLGLCLGMQLMMKRSDEGSRAGLGWFDGETVRFKFDSRQGDLKVPHMGWNQVAPCKDSPLLQLGMPTPRFYFVHSYHIVLNHAEDAAGITNYGYDFASVIERDNILGTQFHPEKSHKFGMKLLKSFAEL